MEGIEIKASVLASGSRGNSTLIVTKTEKVLVDIGTSSLYVEKNLKALDISPFEITSIFITHTHIDHVGGLKVFCKKYNPTVYLTKEMHDQLRDKVTIENYCYIEASVTVGDLNVKVIKTSHDSEDSNGYVFESYKKTVVYITDTGYINKKHYPLLENKNMYIVESNHDLQMLMDTNRPHYLKIRIMGDKGHLSNDDASMYLSEFVGVDTTNIILAHLSEEANCPVLARETLLNKLKKREKQVDNIVVAEQKKTNGFN